MRSPLIELLTANVMFMFMLMLLCAYMYFVLYTHILLFFVYMGRIIFTLYLFSIFWLLLWMVLLMTMLSLSLSLPLPLLFGAVLCLSIIVGIKCEQSIVLENFVALLFVLFLFYVYFFFFFFIFAEYIYCTPSGKRRFFFEYGNNGTCIHTHTHTHTHTKNRLSWAWECYKHTVEYRLCIGLSTTMSQVSVHKWIYNTVIRKISKCNCLTVYVCVRACARERTREREREKGIKKENMRFVPAHHA